MGGVRPHVRYCLFVLAVGISLLVGCVRAKPPRSNDAVAMVPKSQTTATAAASYPGITATATATLPSPTVLMPTFAMPTEAPATLAPPTLELFPTGTLSLPVTDQPVLVEPVATATLLPSPTVTNTLVITQDTPYTVAAGDTLYSVASRFNTSVLAIMNKNALASATSIHLGQTLIIPAGAGPDDPPPLGHVQHTVKANETLSQLGRRYRTTISEIYKSNQAVIPDINHLKPGTVLSITVGTAAEVRTHVVRAGESLSSIARRYGVTMSALAEANALRNPNRLPAGQVLIIPKAGS